MIFVQLLYEFVCVGLFSVGGGLATLPFLYEMGEKTGWFTAADVSNMIAIAESTPGPLGINMATYVGFSTADVAGALIAPLSLIAPSIIITTIIARFLQRFKESELMTGIFYGLRPASTALIAVAGLGVAKIALLNVTAFVASCNPMDLFFWKGILLAGMLYIMMKKLNWHPIFFLFLSGVIGFLFQLDKTL